VKHAVNHKQAQRHGAAGNDREPKSHGNRNAQTKASLKFYDCAGVGHFVRKGAMRLRKEANSTNAPGRKNPTERRRRSRSPGNKPTQNRKGSEQPSHKPGKRELVTNDDSFFHLNLSKNAVKRTKFPIQLEHGTPTISVEIEGIWRSLAPTYRYCNQAYRRVT